MNGEEIFRNEWRYKDGSDNAIIEIIMKDGHITTIDTNNFDKVRLYRWFSIKSGKTRYARAKINGITVSLHKFLFSHIKSPIDHKDWNGLNNITTNIRTGAYGINRRNVINYHNSIIAGISIYEDRKQTSVRWVEADGTPKSKLFSWSKYSSKEEAYEAAVKCRTDNNERVMKYLEEHPPNKPYKRNATKSKNTSGVVGLFRDTNSDNFRAEMTINKQKFRKSFLISTYGDKDKAFEAGKLWIEKIREENPVHEKKRKVAE
jgi:hypothetical protein